MEKRKRTTALGAFTRNENTLKVMFDKSSPPHITPQFDKLKAAWYKLEEAHDIFFDFNQSADTERIRAKEEES